MPAGRPTALPKKSPREAMQRKSNGEWRLGPHPNQNSSRAAGSERHNVVPVAAVAVAVVVAVAVAIAAAVATCSRSIVRLQQNGMPRTPTWTQYETQNTHRNNTTGIETAERVTRCVC